MLIEAAYHNYKNSKKKEKFDKSETNTRDIISAFYILILSIVTTLIVISLAIYSILKCSKANNWSPLSTVMLITSLFIPYYGSLVAWFIIIFAMFGCNNKKRSVGKSYSM